MIKRTSANLFNFIFIIVVSFVFLIVAIRNYCVPFNHDESATFFFFIQSGNYMPFFSHTDANNHVLNSCLGNFCFNVFGSSPFALRIPNLVGFVLMAFATFKLTKQLKQIGSKIVLMSLFILTFNWLSFFSTCRGYGLSMALLLLGVMFVINYFNNENKLLKNSAFALLCFQLAISANLILIISVMVLSFILLTHQFLSKVLFKKEFIFMWLIHFALIIYWLKFSFYLQNSGALYYGNGNSYWTVTFASLIKLLVGTYNNYIKWIVLLFVSLVTIANFFKIKLNFKRSFQHNILFNLSLFFSLIFFTLVIGFYAMHTFLNINFPEDRTGLFFYLFFSLTCCFLIDDFSNKVNSILSILIATLIFVHFLFNLNFRKHALSVYETIPEHFYTTLLQEQNKTSQRITIGGHRVRELFFGFLNYRNNFKLAPADATELMQMNCDYYIATKPEQKYYNNYYSVIDTEPDWGFVLLKRKQKIIRSLIIQKNNIVVDTKDKEYNVLFEKTDTIIKNKNPLLVEINFNALQIQKPANTWFVMQINDSLDNTIYFKRYPLQWIADDLNGKQNIQLSLLTGNLPSKSKKMVCFFWNINTQPLKLTINSLKFYQLFGNGVNYEEPELPTN